jgi:metallophosphoesterase superfamily enzyme
MLELKPEAFHLDDAVAHRVAVCGRQLIADNSGALYWPSQGTLLVADLLADEGHAGPAPANGSAASRPPGLRPRLVRLAEAMDRYDPARVIALGEGADICGTGARMTADELEILRILQEDREWVWVTGREDAGIPPQLGGSACGELEISGIALRHRPTQAWATREIAGHMRPAARLSLYGYALRRACFVGNGRRLVMPAFGAPMDGFNVLDDAFRRLFGNGGMSVWMLGQEGLYPVATRFLAGD